MSQKVAITMVGLILLARMAIGGKSNKTFRVIRGSVQLHLNVIKMDKKFAASAVRINA